MLQPIIITGCRRSGTTLLQKMLTGHPDLLVHPNEPQFFLELYKRQGIQITDIASALQLISQHRYRASAVTPERLAAAFQGTQRTSLREISQVYLELWGGQSLMTQHPVLKHPALVFNLDFVFYLFPEARIIQLVRDPHANISSQRQRWQKATLWECIDWWQAAARAGHFLATNRPEVCLELTYEDLVTKTEGCLRDVCKFVEIPFYETLMSFDLQKRVYSPGERNSEDPQGIRPPDMDAWKRKLTALEIALIEQECHHEMSWWGYELVHPQVPAAIVAGRTVVERFIFSIITLVRRAKGTNWRG